MEPGTGGDAILERWGAGLRSAGLRAARDAFFSRVLARTVVDVRWVGCDGTPAPAAPSLAGLCRDLAAGPGGWLVSARVPANETACRETLEDLGFHLVECYLVLRHRLSGPSGPVPRLPLRDAVERDVSALRAIATSAFDASRMHLDPRIPRELADRSRADWVENAVRGRAERVIVAEAEGSPAGFVCCMRRSAPDGAAAVLDLIAVAPRHRRRGLGEALTQGFLGWARAGGFAGAEVGTQVQNVAAVRLYEAAGFRAASVAYTYHLHAPGGPTS